MKESTHRRALVSVRRGRAVLGHIKARRLAGAIVALLEIAALGATAEAQIAERSAAGLGTPPAPVQSATATTLETRQALGSPRIDISPEELGDLKMLRRNYREAVESYSQGPANDPTLRNKMGIAYHQLGQLENSRKEYLAALQLRPVYMEAANNLGTIEYSKKNFRHAISWYHRALKMEGDSTRTASVHMNLGMAWFARKNYDKANLSFQTALRLDPEVFEHRGTVGQIVGERNVEERSRFHFNMAKLYARQGRNDLAIQYLRKSLEEGYKDRKTPWSEDSAFAALRQLPEFQQLMTIEPRVL